VTQISEPDHTTSSGIPVDAVYGPSALDGWDADDALGTPGEYPFTRGPYPSMYRGRLWTMRQYAGFGTATATNERFHSLLKAGQTGLSVAFDLPTQMGLDSDAPLAVGEVGKVGVAIDTLDDMRRLMDGIPLGEVSTSMTINATAAILLLLYELAAEEQGVEPAAIRGTVQNDILKEYAARGTYVYPPRPSMRLVTDLFAYCRDHLPSWNTISISGYHIREAGSTAAEEVALTLSNGLAYVQAAIAAGLDVDEFAPRLSFFWNGHNGFFEEVAKYRAARRIWADLMRNGMGAEKPESWRMRFHTQTAGSSLTAQQPENNIVRTTLQALAAALGGTQSLHTNSFDEALGLPTDHSARIALRTQQIIGYESGIADTVDPLAGSYFVESLTDALDEAVRRIMQQIEDVGGAVDAIESGVVQRMIEDSAYREAQRVESGESVVVGVNRFVDDADTDVPVMTIDPDVEREQVERLSRHRQERDAGAVDSALERVRSAAAGTENLLPFMKDALRVGATLGEVSASLTDVFGRHRPGG
jgi:methylmalonyl-CoA mutase N-terminal domain/subunit